MSNIIYSKLQNILENMNSGISILLTIEYIDGMNYDYDIKRTSNDKWHTDNIGELTLNSFIRSLLDNTVVDVYERENEQDNMEIEN